MNTERILAAGFGGQGIMSLGYILTYAGMHRHLHVSHFPSYGAEMRGGTANCAMTLSETPIASPIVSAPSAIFIFNEPSFKKFYSTGADNALLLLNSSLITSTGDTRNYTILNINANDEAIALGDARAANMIMLGAYLAKRGDILSFDDIEFGIKKILGHKGEKAVASSLRAVERGAALA